MQTVGRIDIEKFRCISSDIATDEVIITDVQIQHIKEHHPGAYKQIRDYFPLALADPDYILEDEKNPNTGIILKRIEADGLRFQIILRLHTASDPEGYKNSIISSWPIRDKEYKRLIRSKKILYKAE